MDHWQFAQPFSLRVLTTALKNTRWIIQALAFFHHKYFISLSFVSIISDDDAIQWWIHKLHTIAQFICTEID